MSSSSSPPDAPEAPAFVAEPTPQERAQQLKTLFPALFTGAPKPLKLRIQADIQQRAPGVFTKQALSAFLRRHTGSHAYLMAITKGTHRFDLDGAPSGEITEEHRQAAAEELARRRGNTEARRALEDEQRRNRATLLADFQRTTLTPANFCALKGIETAELDGLLEIARAEALEQPRHDPRRDPRGPARPGSRDGPRQEGRHDGRSEGRHEGRNDHRGPPRAGARPEAADPGQRGRGPGPSGPRNGR